MRSSVPPFARYGKLKPSNPAKHEVRERAAGRDHEAGGRWVRERDEGWCTAEGNRDSRIARHTLQRQRCAISGRWQNEQTGCRRDRWAIRSRDGVYSADKADRLNNSGALRVRKLKVHHLPVLAGEPVGEGLQGHCGACYAVRASPYIQEYCTHFS